MPNPFGLPSTKQQTNLLLHFLKILWIIWMLIGTRNHIPSYFLHRQTDNVNYRVASLLRIKIILCLGPGSRPPVVPGGHQQRPGGVNLARQQGPPFLRGRGAYIMNCHSAPSSPSAGEQNETEAH